MHAGHISIERLDAIVSGAQSGDPTARRDLLTHSWPLAERTARRMVVAADVDDVVQDTLIQVVRSIGSLRDARALPAWIVVIARHAANGYQRRRARLVPVGDIVADYIAGGFEDDAVAQLSQDRIVAAVRSAIGRVTDGERRVLELVVVEQMPYEQAARALGRPVGSIGPVRQRALRKLATSPEIMAVGL